MDKGNLCCGTSGVVLYPVSVRDSFRSCSSEGCKEVAERHAWASMLGSSVGMSVSMVENGTISPDQMYEPDRARVGC